MRGVHVVLEQLVLAEGGGAHRALVREVGWLQHLLASSGAVLNLAGFFNLSVSLA